MPMQSPGFERLQQYGLLKAMQQRRSRRFASGAHLTGPLEFRSSKDPEPLTEEEEALLAFAASGITGYALADLPYPDSTTRPTIAGMTILAQLVGRTTPSGDALNNVIVFVMNDNYTYALRRPQDLTDDKELKECIRLVRAGEFVEAYRLLRVEIAKGRVTIPQELPYTLPFNNWSANQPGTTYFLPISEVSALYVNCLLWAFGDDVRYYVLDERSPLSVHRPLDQYRASKGGYLDDDAAHNRVLTVGLAEALMYEFAALEQGLIIQNLALMTQALGLGGFPHYAAHPYAWFQALDFKMDVPKYSTTVGGGWIVGLTLWLNRLKDIDVPTAVGFNDRWGLLQPFCKPNWPTMREAVLAYAEKKAGELLDPDDNAWRPELVPQVESGFPPYSERTKQAAIDYCEYIQDRYHMFPAHGGPFRTEQAFQAHHLDLNFYQEFYKPDAVSDTQEQHWASWHREQYSS